MEPLAYWRMLPPPLHLCVAGPGLMPVAQEANLPHLLAGHLLAAPRVPSFLLPVLHVEAWHPPLRVPTLAASAPAAVAGASEKPPAASLTKLCLRAAQHR